MFDDPLRGIEEAAAGLSEAIGAEEIEHLTDLGNARRLVNRHGKNLRFCHGRGWLYWDGLRWRVDKTNQIERYAKDTVLEIYEESRRAGDEDRPKLATWASKSESEARIRAMISLAQSEPEMILTPEQLDADPWLFNAHNGTIDLRTGKIREHRRGDLITKLSPVVYDPLAKCPRFDAFIYEIMDGKEDLIRYLRGAIGYSLTGDTREQALFLGHGFGANGKTTLLDVFLYILNDYAMQANFTTFLSKDTDGIRNDVAALAGARFVSAVEVESGRRLSEVLVKQLTGGDVIRARFLYQNEFEFKPTAKFWLAANHKPVIRGGGHGIWRRIRLIPFAVTIPEERRDKTLSDKLRSEASGILAWAVRGCLEWQERGLDPPDEVKAATAEYRSEMDVIGEFLSDCCIVQPEARAAASDLYQKYSEWSGRSGEKNTMSKRTFGQCLAERGFEAVRTTAARFWKGIGVTQ